MTMRALQGSLSAAGVTALVLGLAAASPALAQDSAAEHAIKLGPPREAGGVSVEQALKGRRSLRAFSAQPMTLAEVGQLLWAAQGMTDGKGRRAAPSAGALYPLELLLVAGNVTGLAPGIYRYRPASHDLVPVAATDRRPEVAAACRQGWVGQAPAIVAVAAVEARTARKYGARATRYVAIEVGAAAENLALQAGALGLGTTVVGAFDDAKLAAALQTAGDENPLVLLPVGRK
jgi:SagB-type dehydrogenase family enzyme